LATSLLKDFEERWSDNVRTFNDTVQRGRKNRQEGIHPALQIATFLDPRFKTLVSIPGEESRTAIQERVLELMKESETKNCENTAVAPAPTEVEEEEKDEVWKKKWLQPRQEMKTLGLDLLTLRSRLK